MTPPRKLLLTIAVGEYYQSMARISHPGLKRYAASVGAEFVSIENAHAVLTPHFQKLLIPEFLKTFDRILFFDTDILVRQDTPDLFQLVPREQIGLLDQVSHYPKAFANYLAWLSGLNLNLTPSRYFNTGVMVLAREHSALFEAPLEVLPDQIPPDFEQAVINLRLHQLSTPVYELPLTFNHLVTTECETPNPLESYVTHYAGYKRFGRDEILEWMQTDAETWRSRSLF